VAALVGTSNNLVLGIQYDERRQIKATGLTLKTIAIFKASDDFHYGADDITGTIQPLGEYSR
jgi:hypothetical protein